MNVLRESKCEIELINFLSRPYRASLTTFIPLRTLAGTVARIWLLPGLYSPSMGGSSSRSI